MSLAKLYLVGKHLMTQKSFQWNLKTRYHERQLIILMLQWINTEDRPTSCSYTNVSVPKKTTQLKHNIA